MTEISNKKLYLIVFSTGAIVMILELVGSRILAPVFGTSIFVWTSLIGIILGAMSLGYYFGGKLADKNQSLKIFSSIILFAGVFVYFIIIFKNIVFEFSADAGLKSGVVLSAIILFFIPAVLLGAVSPYAVKLSMKRVENAGNTVGNLYAVSTFGSITGTFAAGFYLIPNFGSTNILYALAIALFLISLFIHASKKRTAQTALAMIFFTGLAISSNAAEKNIFIVNEDSVYSRIRVYDTENLGGKKVRIMSVENFFDSGMFLDSDELVFFYSEFFRLDAVFKKKIDKTVIFGGAAYSISKDFLVRNKTGEMDVVEIDSRTTEIAKEYFRLEDNKRLHIHHEDARMFLNDSEKLGRNNKYDVVYNDAFSSTCAVPFHLTTKESIKKIHDLLKDDGIYVINLISAVSGEKSGFFKSEHKTIKNQFENVFVFLTKSKDKNIEILESVQNIVIIATKKEFDINKVLENNTDDEVENLLQYHMEYNNEDSNVKILTDDFAPVNFYALKNCE